ncbi:diacylglycerol kinase family protein [Chlorobium sp. KB01]|uniref:diacylglycerol/lipid kinase family protein n=1 Tax=Chlorobium sp. KB01 TaxID=1917528 RepID=UPI00097893F8|nr:diacylglycerol kinase family protein [Chlorobium sp. KB01]
MTNRSRYLFIFNPAADKGRASRKSAWLEALVTESQESVMVRTTHAGHAGVIARAEHRQRTSIISCGGDGTLHEVVNAVAGEGCTVGVLPFGSGNDFIKTLNPERKQRRGISHFFKSGSREVDLGRVAFANSDHRFFINSLGIGFTGRVAKSVKGAPWLKGELAYLYALLTVLAGYSAPKMKITITLENSVLELDEPVFAFSVSNGKVEGGKFRIAPHAEITDGLLDVCILKGITKLEFFPYVFKYLNGTQINDPKVIYCKAKAVDVTLTEPDVMHMDGEVYDDIHGRVAISVVPNGITMLCDLSEDSEPKKV